VGPAAGLAGAGLRVVPSETAEWSLLGSGRAKGASAKETAPTRGVGWGRREAGYVVCRCWSAPIP